MFFQAECYGLSFVTFHSPPEEEAEVEKDKDSKAVCTTFLS